MIQKKKVNSSTVQFFGCTIGRNEILSRYWELANIDPSSTKDTMTGQLNALTLLWEALAPQPADDAPLKPDMYRAAWMPESTDTRPA